MILPENGSVVVIDDDPNQARPIIDILAKKGIATTYFKGTGEKEVPGKPLKNVRLAILDLQLNPMDKDGHTIATRLVNVLNMVISDNNGPFMVLIWSLKDELFGEEFRNEVKKHSNSRVPVCIASLEKVKCLERSELKKAEEFADSMIREMKSRFDEEDLVEIRKSIISNYNEEDIYEPTPNAFEEIEASLKKSLEMAGAFHLFVIWENLIKTSASQTIDNISKTLPIDDSWEQNIRDVFRRMGIARVGKNEVTDGELLKESMHTLIQSFSDKLETKIQQVKLPAYISKKAKQLIKVLVDKDEASLVHGASGFQILINGKTLDGGGDLGKLQSKLSSISGDEQKLAMQLIALYNAIPPKLNTGLHIDCNPTQVHIPGNVFEISVTDIENRKKYLQTYFKSVQEERLNEITFIELEMSPICDYAQKNWKKSRLLSGIIYPADIHIREKGHFYPVEPVFFLDNKFKKIVFDCHLLKSLDHELVEKRKAKYRIRRDLLLDIVAKVAAHVNRPGISFLT